MRGESGVNVSPGKQDGNGVQLEGIEGLLSDVVITDVILQRQIELVLLVDEVKAGVRVDLVRVPESPVLATLHVAALAVDVDPDVLCQPPEGRIHSILYFNLMD